MDSLKKVIDLAKKNGNKVIIVDSDGNPTYILMAIDQYFSLNEKTDQVKDLTEGELLTKINCDIAAWKEVQEAGDNPIETEDLAKNVWSEAVNEEISLNLDNFDQESDDLDEEDQYYFEPVE